MHFYPGLSPMVWLSEVPRAWVRACLQMIPRLIAEEAIQRTNEIGVGSGAAGDQGREIARHWSEVARAGQQPIEPLPPTAPRVAAMGLASVEIVKAGT